MQTSQYRKSGIWEMKEGKYTKSLAKSQPAKCWVTQAWKFKPLLSQNEEPFGTENLCKLRFLGAESRNSEQLIFFSVWILVTSCENPQK